MPLGLYTENSSSENEKKIDKVVMIEYELSHLFSEISYPS